MWVSSLIIPGGPKIDPRAPGGQALQRECPIGPGARLQTAGRAHQLHGDSETAEEAAERFLDGRGRDSDAQPP